MSGQQFLSETRERFLKAILKELPVERVREIYLFQPIKQGGVESGVAVVAGLPELETTSGVGGEGSGANDVAPDAVEESRAEDVEPEAHEALSDAVVVLPHGADESPAPVEASGFESEGSGVEIEEAGVNDEESPEAVAPDSQPPTPDAVEEAPDSQPPTPDAVEPQPPTPDAEKYTVYTARYRHVLKGPDRGKWEASIVAEADAPLLSIETVVRGVQRRSGDVEPPDHMTAADVRAALRLPTPDTSDAA